LEEVVSLLAFSGGPSRLAETRWRSNKVLPFDLQGASSSESLRPNSGRPMVNEGGAMAG
jgi:hypothetical protein